MTRRERVLLAALAVSIALHLAFVFGIPEFRFEAPEPPQAPLDARLVMREPEPPPPPAPPPQATPAPPPQAKPAPKPRPIPRVARTDAPAPVAEPAPPAAAPASAAPAAAPSAPPAASEPSRPATAATPPVPAAAYPVHRARLVYDLLYSDAKTRVGRVVHTWVSMDGRYEAESAVEAVGFASWIYRGRFVQHSKGTIGPNGLQPEAYWLDRGRGDPPEIALFHWSDGKVELSWKNEHRAEALPPGAQDPLSAVHQLYFMQPLPASSTVAVATGRKLNRYVYEVQGDADLETPMGTLRTLHIGRVEDDGSVLELWLDRDRSLLPVRIYSVDRKGLILDQVVREIALSD